MAENSYDLEGIHLPLVDSAGLQESNQRGKVGEGYKKQNVYMEYTIRKYLGYKSRTNVFAPYS